MSVPLRASQEAERTERERARAERERAERRARELKDAANLARRAELEARMCALQAAASKPRTGAVTDHSAVVVRSGACSS